MNVKEFSNPMGDLEDENMEPETVEPEPTDISDINESDLENLFADDPELLQWWRNLGNNNNE